MEFSKTKRFMKRFMKLSKKREDTCNELFVNMQGVMLNSYYGLCKPGRISCPVLHFLHLN